MQTIRTLTVLLSLFSAVLPFTARAADVAFFPVETANVAPADATAIGELLAQSYASISGKAVLAPSRISLSAPEYVQAAKELGVSEYVRTDAVAAGSRVIVHSVRYQADGTQIYSARLTTERIEDMPAVADRIARSLYEKVDDEAVRTRRNVTLGEGRPQSRAWTEKVVGFKAGGHVPLAKGARYASSLSLMFDMRMESDRYFIEFGAGILIPTKSGDYCGGGYDTGCTNEGRLGGLASEIGASFFLTDSNVAPYIGGGILPRLQFASDEDDAANLAAYAQFGLTLPRDSSTRVYMDLRVAQHILGVHLDNGKETFPTELSLQAGIGW